MLADVICSAEELPFLDQSFDVVVTRLAAHHYSDVRCAIGEMERVAITSVVIEDTLWDGDLLETVYRLHDPTHVKNHSTAEWVTLLSESGLDVDRLEVVPKIHQFGEWLASTQVSDRDAHAIRNLLGDRLANGHWADRKIVLRGRPAGAPANGARSCRRTSEK
jgi:hypothetical protein